MGIQFKQIDGLSSRFSSLSGNLQSQITSNTNATSGLLSGTSIIGGWTYFTGNVDFSGAQGILVDPNSIYTPNNVFAGGVKVGYPISTPRNSTSGPKGALQVSGGQSYFEGQVNIDNNAGIQISNGDITAGTGNLHFITGETLAYGAGNFTGSLTLKGNPVYTGSGVAGSSCSGFSGFLDPAGSSYQAISCEDTFTFSGCSGIAASIAGNTLSICYTGTGGGGGGGTTYTAGSGLTLIGTEFNTAGIGVFTQVSGESGVFTDTLTISGNPVYTGSGVAGSSCSGFSGFSAQRVGDTVMGSYQATSCDDTFNFSGNGTTSCSIAGSTLTIDGGSMIWSEESGNFSAGTYRPEKLGFFVDSSYSYPLTATMYSSPTMGDEICFVDYASTWNASSLRVDWAGNKFTGSSVTYTEFGSGSAQGSICFVYTNSSIGWVVKSTTLTGWQI